jgi:hypothetical protein
MDEPNPDETSEFIDDVTRKRKKKKIQAKNKTDVRSSDGSLLNSKSSKDDFSKKEKS